MMIAHGSAFGTSVPVVMKFCDRGESFKRALEGTTSALESLRKEIAEELRDHVSSFLATQPRVASVILSVDGKTPYEERPANPTESEAYRDTIHKYATKRVETLGAYHALIVARDAWSYWARMLGWLVYFFWVWELAVLVLLAAFGKMGGYKIPAWVLVASAVPSVMGLVTTAAALAAAMHWQDRILDERRKHEKL